MRQLILSASSFRYSVNKREMLLSFSFCCCSANDASFGGVVALVVGFVSPVDVGSAVDSELALGGIWPGAGE